MPIEINYELDRAYTLKPFRYMCTVMRREIIRVDWHDSRRVLLDEASGFIGRGQQGRAGMYANFPSRLHTEREHFSSCSEHKTQIRFTHIWHKYPLGENSVLCLGGNLFGIRTIHDENLENFCPTWRGFLMNMKQYRINIWPFWALTFNLLWFSFLCEMKNHFPSHLQLHPIK